MSDDFFVGYLSTPPKLRRMLVGISLLLLIAAGALAATIALSQRDPGTGVWKDSELDSLGGTLLLDPYPMLQMSDARMILLVGTGKHGVAQRLQSASGRAASIKGHLLQRNGWTMLEIEDSADSVQPAGSAEAIQRFTMDPTGETRNFRGEIIDPKCYLGAMKPGDGKTHKACAALCIRGGIPPAFVAKDSSGSTQQYLLVDSDGHGLAGDRLENILPFVGDAIELSGRAQQLGDLRVLALDPGSMRRR